MAHFANIDPDNNVRDVVPIANDALNNLPFPESEPVGQEFLAQCGMTGTWLQCSYSASFRGWYPGPGFTYDPVLDVFVPPPAPEPPVES